MPVLVSTVDVPEPFRSALMEAPIRAADAEAPTPEALFGRAMARIAVGREGEARADLEAAMPHLGDPCRLELAFLDIRQRSSVKAAAILAKLIAERAKTEGNAIVQARALHIVGLAQGKMRRTSLAIDALLDAAGIYGALGDRLGTSQVYDTLGTVQAAKGRLDHAMNFYALSLVDKTLLGDRTGMAITLGNLGRVHLRAGRFRDAIACFDRDLEIATELSDLRGQGRMHGDLGRAYLGLEDLDKAESELATCLAIATEHGFADQVFFARKDLCLLRIAGEDLAEAEKELAAAEAALPEESYEYFHLTFLAARGELLRAKGGDGAIDVLREVVDRFEQAHLPDNEIAARISLAKAFVARNYKALAEQCLSRGLRLARHDGYARYLPLLNEAMAELELVAGVIDETHRRISSEADSAESNYLIRGKLGEGGFGAVFRVFDPRRGCDVALKRLRLTELYDMGSREKILKSARVELEAASRVRHPGVVRVLAIGSEPEGGAYIVQEYVSGRPLREMLPGDTSADASEVLWQIERIADALEALHRAGVIHRDIKPENILVREDGSPVLVDFGLAHMVHSRVAQDSRIAGTLLYMAPEQALGKRITPRTDLYSLGVVCFEWLAGICPLRPRGDDLKAIARDIASRLPTPLSDFRPDLAPEVERLVMSMLAKKPRQRPGSALDVAESCRALREAGPTAGSLPSTDP